jgi:putative DNA primase/helicase
MIANCRAADTNAAPQTDSEIDLGAAADFLEALGAKYPTFQTFGEGEAKGDKKLARIMDGTLKEHSEKLCDINLCGAGVFVSVNQTDGRGRKRENIKRVRAVILDLDGAPLDPVTRCRLKPQLVIESSPGRFHVFWIVEEDFPLDKFEGVQRALARRFDGDPAVAHLNVCVRLPGFFHNKAEPFRTRIAENNDQALYTAEQILTEFPPEAKPHRPSGGRHGVVLPAGAPVSWAEAFLEHCYSANGVPLLRAYRGAFYEYTGTHYRELADETVEAKIYQFLKQCHIANEKGVVPFRPTKGKVGETLHALRRGTATLISRDREAPCWLDQREASAANLVSVRNGILNLESRQLIAHDVHFFTLNSLPIDYDPEAPKPTNWYNFLEQLWPDDEDAECCLQEIFGYLLTPDTRQHKLFLIVGPKRAGKGTITFVLMQLLGTENVAFPTFRSLAGEFGRWPLIGKSLAVIADARLGSKADVHAVAEQLLSISGGDPQTINRKNQPFWTGYLGVRFLITSNELPTIADVSGTLPSRYVLLNLSESFYGREDLSLKEKFLPELPGILNWALVGRRRLLRRGYFKVPASSLESVRQLEDLAAPVAAFVRGRCVVGANRRIEKNELYGVNLGVNSKGKSRALR